MTLISMVAAVCGELAVPPVSSAVDNNDIRSIALLALAKRSLVEVSEARDWPHLLNTTAYTFDTVIGQAEYSMPADFNRMAPDTLFDTEADYRMVGGTTIQLFQRASVISSPMDKASYRVHGSGVTRRLIITPTPDVVKTISYWYYSSYYAVSSTGDFKETFTSDADTTRVPENLVELDLKWRYARQRGQDYAEEFREYQDKLDKVFSQSIPPRTILLGGSQYDESPLTEGYVPDTGYGA